MKFLKGLFVLLAVVVFAVTACTPAAETPAAEEAPAAEGAPEQAPAEETAPEAPAEEAPAAESGGTKTLVLAMNMDDLMTLDLALVGETTNQLITKQTYQTLTEYSVDDFLTPLPNVAESWELSDDLTEYTFHLKAGQVFASGNPLTAADVCFSYMRGKNMASGFYEMIAGCEVVDDLTAKVMLNVSSASFMADTANPALGIQDSVLVKEHGGTDAEDAATTDTAKEWLDQNSAGSGPYIMTSWATLSEIVLVKNPNYQGDAPYYDQILIKHVSDPTVALQMLQTGDADMVPYVDYDLADMAQADPALQTYINQSLDINYLAMTSSCNTEIGPESAALLCIPEVRKAVVAAVDYDGLIQAILRGYGVRPPSMFPIGIPGVDAAETEGRDVEKAKQYLTDAGYPDGITLDLYYPTNAVRDTIAAKIQSDLGEAGITVKLNPMEQTVYLTEMRAQKLPFCFGGWTPDYIDPIMWIDGFSDINTGISKRMLYDNSEAAAIGDQIVATADPATRIDLINQLEAIWLQDSAFTVLYQTQSITAIRADIQGFSYHPAYMTKLYSLYE